VIVFGYWVVWEFSGALECDIGPATGGTGYWAFGGSALIGQDRAWYLDDADDYDG